MRPGKEKEVSLDFQDSTDRGKKQKRLPAAVTCARCSKMSGEHLVLQNASICGRCISLPFLRNIWEDFHISKKSSYVKSEILMSNIKKKPLT